MKQHTVINPFKGKKIQPEISLKNIQEGKDKTFKKINLRSTRFGREREIKF
jgi:hypothetical protein